MNDHFKSLDATVASIKADCESQLKAMSDKLLAAEIEATLSRDLLAKAISAKEEAIASTARLIAQFDIAEKAFGDAKNYAMGLRKEPEPQ